MKLQFLLLTALVVASTAQSQDLPYAQKAAQVQKEIWGTTEPEFKATKVPDDLKNESAVVLARSFSSQRSITGRFKFMVITAGIAQRNAKFTTLHERVKINDKVALEEYSQLEYQKTLDKTTNLLVTRFVDTHNTFIGIKIIKPDGKEVIVNTGEEVLTQNETKDKKGKIAISDLQIGDVLDYYISKVDISEKGENVSYSDNDDIIVLADEYPVLYYSLNFQFNKKVQAKYINANNAPAFKESYNNDGDLVLSLIVRNLPKYKSQLWTSTLRQYPYIEIGSAPLNSQMIDGGGKGLNGLSMIARNKALFQQQFIEFPGYDRVEKKMKDFFDSNKALKAAPRDSVMKILYDTWKFETFCEYTGEELDEVNSMNYRKANSRIAAIIMSMILADMDIEHEILLVSSRNSNALENAFTRDDFETAIRIIDIKPMYMFFDDVITHFNEIPARFQGERAMVIQPRRRSSVRYTFTDMTDALLPVTDADKNYQEEHLQVSFVPANMQKLKFDRTVKEAGNIRHDDQKLLIPVQDIDNGYMEMVKGETLEKRLSQIKKTKKMTENYNYMFGKEREEMTKNFTTDIKNTFDIDPEQVTNLKIVNRALENQNPVFEFSSSFVLNNLVKKAGNNYIVDAGKLTGGFMKLDEKDKIRDKDVYMPSARTFKYAINVTIPQGYSVSGAEDLNINKSNSTGSFISTAKINGNTLTLTVTRSYLHNFEKAADWPKIVELIQAGSDFTDKKILFEKKG